MSGAETLRAAAEVFVPGPPFDPTPGAADIEADRFIAHYLDFLLPGLAEGVPQLLDGVAALMFDERPFMVLTLEERAQVFDSLSTREVEQVRELPDLIGLLAIAAMYGEWSGQDSEGEVVRQPLGWEMTGFSGPVRARANLLREGR